MACECDVLLFPMAIEVPAGLRRLDRQLAAFPQWRQAILAAIGRETALDAWNARERHDLGVMLVEMWAYVCDVVSFYDGAIAHESYLRTAQQRPSTRKLVDLLGYLPRPAVAAHAVLAAQIAGRKTVVLPAQAAFRSTEYDGHPPEVFELGAPVSLHPLNNRWPVARPVPRTIGASIADVNIVSLMLEPGTVRLAKGDIAVLRAGASAFARRVTSVTPVDTVSRRRYVRVTFDAAIALPGTTEYDSMSLWSPTVRGAPWTRGKVNAADEDAIQASGALVLDTVHRSLGAGEIVVLASGSSLQAVAISAAEDKSRTLLNEQSSDVFAADGTTKTAVVKSPAVTISTTRLTLASAIAGSPTASTLVVHYGLAPGGRIVAVPKDTLEATDALDLDGVFEAAPVAPPGLLFEDANGRGVATAGSVDTATRDVVVDTATSWPQPLSAPVTLYGNAITVTRGETVRGEVLGIGNGAAPRQTFTLKKKPLTYLPAANAGNDAGVASTLVVRVDNVRWDEVATFFGVAPDAQAYIVRQDDAGDTHVTFGGGARLPSGSVVVADYRHGAGAACPPSGTITQLAKPVQGLSSVRNPLAAFGGADPESASALAAYAPRSALLLGRAISLPDFEAAAASVPGVRAVAADWRYSTLGQRPMVHLYYIGDAQLANTLRARLMQLSDPTTPIAVEAAVGDVTRIAMDIAIDPAFVDAAVLNRVRDALFAPATTPGTGGVLRPEQAGIGRALFVSRLHEAVLNVPGTKSVTSLLVNGAPPASYGIVPAAGHYFDFERGAVLLNGRAGYVEGA
ncbi:MAG: hypothetical protein U1F54_00220 [Burkholderiales bacterium]